MLLAEGKACKDCFYYKPKKDKNDKYYELFEDKPCTLICRRTWKDAVNDYFKPEVLGY